MAIHHLHTEIEIEAPADKVWAILTDFSSYPQWNPFIRSVVGTPRAGECLQITVQPSGGSAMRFTPVVLVSETGHELRWRGRVLVPGLFDGEHSFVIEPLQGGRVCFKHGERFRGLLVGFLRKSLDRDTRRGFEEMNLALKARAESDAQAADELEQF
jgi:hypothetical protein